MQSMQPNQILGDTKTITAATTAPSAVQVPTLAGETGPRQFVVTNLGTDDAYLGIGHSAAAASTRATATLGTSHTRIILGRSQISITCDANAWWTAVTAANTSVITIEPGSGF